MRKDKLHAMHDWKFEDDTGLENVIAYTSSSGIPARAGSVAGKATDVNLYQIGTDGTLTDAGTNLTVYNLFGTAVAGDTYITCKRVASVWIVDAEDCG